MNTYLDVFLFITAAAVGLAVGGGVMAAIFSCIANARSEHKINAIEKHEKRVKKRVKKAKALAVKEKKQKKKSRLAETIENNEDRSWIEDGCDISGADETEVAKTMRGTVDSGYEYLKEKQ